MFSQWISSQVAEGPASDDLLAKVMPDYPATGKRTLQDNGSWLRTLQGDNVELVRTPIQRITPRGIVTEDGVTHDVDIIVYATGFRHTDVLWPLKVVGRNGIDLRSMWGSRPYAYLGITVPGFPNLFLIYGPGTHLAHGGSLIFQSELQMRYIDQCLQHLVEANLHSLEPTPRRPPNGISGRKPKSRRWCGRTRPSNTRTSRTPTERSTPSAPGASTSTGPRYASPTGHNSLRDKKTERDKESEHANMRTVVIERPGAVRVETVPDPALPGPDGVIVAVTAAAICGSDLHFYEGEYPIGEPVALGHEAIGTVVEAGPQVRTVKAGDLVMVSAVAGCGTCAGCATRDPVMCSSGPQIFGGGVLGGAQADLLAVPAADFLLLKIPEGISTEQALLLTDNLATGWARPSGPTFRSGARSRCSVWERSACVRCAARFSKVPQTVFAVDRVAGRLERAAKWGRRPSRRPPSRPSWPPRAGRGADSVIDAVATDASLTDALNAVRPGGTVSVVGVHDLNPFPFPALGCLIRSITLRMTTAPVQRTWPELIPLLQSGRLDVDGIFTTTLPLDEASKGYATAASRSGDDVKILLTP